MISAKLRPLLMAMLTTALTSKVTIPIAMTISKRVLTREARLIAIVLNACATNISAELADTPPAPVVPLQIDDDFPHIIGIKDVMGNSLDGDRAIISGSGGVNAGHIKRRAEGRRDKISNHD